ncbi:uncharacterized protein LOC131651208 [Vicia villosa]|uniref:uncharacterized protein LOC131651208 n=1 Tax=Vicia villosa TaxID=3911 RepID=UPI00273BA877|nr:uncharacterized protein LOC131651208 [Vicia villosa]
MDEVTLHWKRLSFDDDGCIKEESSISITSKLEAIQDRFSKADDNMKLYIKEQLRKIGFPETTDMKPPSQPVKTKGAPKKVKFTSNDNSTTRDPSYCTYCSKNSSIEEVHIAPNIPFIDEMSVFMHKYIDRIVNMVGDGNCGFRAVSALLGKENDDHKLVRLELLEELMNHKDSYTWVFGDETKFESVNEALVPWLGAYAPMSKWMRFMEMGHLIACAYDMVCIDLTRYGFSKTFFRSAPHLLQILVIVLCVLMARKIKTFCASLLETGCSIPHTSPKWALHHTEAVDTWPNRFVDMMHDSKG